MSTPENRYRIEYGEHDDLRFIGHLDLARAWERTFRRASIELAYSQGFNPRPRLNFGIPLPLGCTSQADLVEAWLLAPIDPDQLVARLQAAAPPGLRIERAVRIEHEQPKLQRLIRAAEFEVPLPAGELEGLAGRIDELLAAKQIVRQRRGKSYDLRPLIEAVALRPEGELWMRLAARPDAVGRADEVLRELGLPAEQLIPHRARLVLKPNSA